MFSNRFNTKNDPLLEAVQNAMQDGEIRRQAVAQVNEAFGVYNRNAVVREDLADYDTAIEDVYYFMKEDIDFEFILEGEDDDYAKKYAGDAKPTGVDREGGSSRRKRLTARAKIRQKMGPGKIKVSPEGISHTKRGKEMGDYDTTNYFDRKGNKVGRNTATIEVEREEYDARLEEAYKCMKEGEKKDEKKEDKPKADYSKMREKMVGKGKDLETTRKIVGEGNDGNLANNYPPYDKVTRGDVIAGATGKDQMGGKKKKMEEEQIDEISKKTYVNAMRDATDPTSGRDGNPDKIVSRAKKYHGEKFAKDLEGVDKSHYPRAGRTNGMKKKMDEEQIDEISKKLAARYGEKAQREIDTVRVYGGPRDTETHNKMKRRGEGVRLAKAKIQAPRVPATEETDYSAPDRAAVTRDNKPSTPAQTNAATSGPSAADKAALTNKIKTMQEAAYSAKAARAGKDIGKPGKEFKKIAKSAAARYGSEERGKKVAGAILKRIRAKHMREADMSSGTDVTSALPKNPKNWENTPEVTMNAAREARKSLEGSKGEIKKDSKYPGL